MKHFYCREEETLLLKTLAHKLTIDYQKLTTVLSDPTYRTTTRRIAFGDMVAMTFLK